MGAGAARAVKQLEYEEPEKAAAILSVVQAFDENSEDISENQLQNIEFFKKRILNASEESKLNGTDVEASLSRITTGDIEKFNQFIALDRKSKGGAGIDETNTLDDADSGDERMSVLSYEDEEEEESTAVTVDERLLGRIASKSTLSDHLIVQNLELSTAELDAPVSNIRISPVQSVGKKDTSDDEDDDDPDDRDSPVQAKIYPSISNSSINSDVRRGGARSDDDSGISGNEGPPHRRIITSDLPQAPLIHPSVGDDLALPSPAGFYDMIDSRNKTLMNLQKTKVWSYAHNAQLEREVELLQKQLETIEALEKDAEKERESQLYKSTPAKAPLIYTGSSSSPLNDSPDAPSYPRSSIAPHKPIHLDDSQVRRRPIGQQRRQRSNRSSTDEIDNDYKSDNSVDKDSKAVEHSDVVQSSVGIVHSSNPEPRNRPRRGPRIRHNDGDLSPRPNRHSLGKGLAAIDEVSETSPRMPAGSNDDHKADFGFAVQATAPTREMPSSSKDRPAIRARRARHTSKPHRVSSDGEASNRSSQSPDDSEQESGRGKLSVAANRRPVAHSDSESESGAVYVPSLETASEKLRSVAVASLNEGEEQEDSRADKHKHQKHSLLRNLRHRRASRENIQVSDGGGSENEDARPRLGQVRSGMNSHVRVNRANARNRGVPSSEASSDVEGGFVEGGTEVHSEHEAGTAVEKKPMAVTSQQQNQLHRLKHNARSRHDHAVAPAAAPAVDNARKGVWSDTLDMRWGEVDLLLRKPIESEADLLYTIAAAEAGLMFTDQLNEVAKSLQVLRGTLSRWLLPYDHNTRIDEQCSTPHSVVAHMPEMLKGRVTERQVHYLVAGVNSVRKLVRVKIADDNDLDQARRALKTASDFFKLLQDTAAENQMTMYQVLESRDR